MDSAQLGQVIVGAVLTAALAGLATLGALLVGLRQEARRRRAERRFEAAERVLENVDRLRISLRRGDRMVTAIDVSKSRLVFQVAELRAYGISHHLEEAVSRVEAVVLSLNEKTAPATMDELEREVMRFQEAVVAERPRR